MSFNGHIMCYCVLFVYIMTNSCFHLCILKNVFIYDSQEVGYTT